MTAPFTPESLTELLEGITEESWATERDPYDLMDSLRRSVLRAAALDLARQLKDALEREHRVRELHAPVQLGRYITACKGCRDINYPCITIQALDREGA